MNSNKVRNILLLLSQFGFTHKTLEKIYLNEEYILEVIFDPNFPFYNKYYEFYSNKEKELSNDFSKLQNFTKEFINKMVDYKQKGIKIFFKYDDDFPSNLFLEEDAPLFIYSYGEINLLNKENKKIAIVGTRNPNLTSIDKTKDYVKKYVEKNWIIVSGLAKGIDTVVHKETLKNIGRTIAVLPTSFETIYPVENKSLFYDIYNNDGLLLTKVGPFENTYKSSFLERNSIVAKISDEILIVEASKKSGTLNTVRKGFEYGKKILYDSDLLDEEVVEYIGRYNPIDINF